MFMEVQLLLGLSKTNNCNLARTRSGYDRVPSDLDESPGRGRERNEDYLMTKLQNRQPRCGNSMK